MKANGYCQELDAVLCEVCPLRQLKEEQWTAAIQPGVTPYQAADVLGSALVRMDDLNAGPLATMHNAFLGKESALFPDEPVDAMAVWQGQALDEIMQDLGANVLESELDKDPTVAQDAKRVVDHLADCMTSKVIKRCISPELQDIE